MAPVFLSGTRVDPGMPCVSHESKGMETTFMVMPRLEMHAGMKSAQFSGMSIVVLCGDQGLASITWRHWHCCGQSGYWCLT